MKESGWLRHDIGARNDVKIQKMVWRFGFGAKAIYWDIIEMLAEEGGQLSFDTLEYVSFSNGLADTTLAENVVKDTGLFEYDETFFWSNRLLEEIKLTKELKEKKREAGRRSGEVRRSGKLSNETINTQTKMNTCSTGDEQNRTPVEPIHNNTEHNNTIDNILLTNVSMSEKISDAEVGKEEKLFPEEEKPEESGETQQVLTIKECQQVIDFWNTKIQELGAQFPKVATLSDNRRKKICIRWKEFAKVGNPIDVMKIIVEKACASKFLQGDSKNGWSASFDWIFTNDKNWLKIYEGNYDEKPAGMTQTPQAQQFQQTDFKTGIKYVNQIWEQQQK